MYLVCRIVNHGRLGVSDREINVVGVWSCISMQVEATKAERGDVTLVVLAA